MCVKRGGSPTVKEGCKHRHHGLRKARAHAWASAIDMHKNSLQLAPQAVSFFIEFISMSSTLWVGQ